MAEQILIGGTSESGGGFTNELRLFGTHTICSLSGVATKMTYRAPFVQRDGTGRFALYQNNTGALLAQSGLGSVTSGVDFSEDFVSPVAVTASTTYYPSIAGDAATDNKNIFQHTFNGDSGTQDFTSYREYTMSAIGDALPDPYSGVASSNFYFAGYVSGYVPPTITSIDGDNEIDSTQTGVALVGTDLVDSAGNPTLELCNNSDYGTATIKVTQSINSSNDTGINFDVVQGGLSAGTVYAFVTTALGQRNAAFSVTLSAGAATNNCTIASTSATSSWSSAAVQENVSSLSFVSAPSDWVAITEQKNDSVVSFVSAPSGWVQLLSQNNTAVAALVSASCEWLSQSEQQNVSSVIWSSPGSEWSIIATNSGTNECTVSIVSPAGEWSAILNGQNAVTVGSDSPASLWASHAEQQNNSDVSFSSPSSDWLASAELENNSTVNFSSPGSSWTGQLSQNNDASIIFTSPSSEWLIVIDGVVTNQCTIVSQSAASSWVTSQSQQNSVSVSFVSPGGNVVVSVDQMNNISVVSQSGASVWDISNALKNAATIAADSPGSQWQAIIQEAAVNLCTVASSSASSSWNSTLLQNNISNVIFESIGSTWSIVIPPTNIPTTGLIRISSGDTMLRLYSNEKEPREV